MRPNEKGFDSILKALLKMGFKIHRLGMYQYKTPYHADIEVYGDRQQGHIPSKRSEYLVVQISVRKNQLDGNTQTAIYNLQMIRHPGERKRIRDGFIPRKEFENGPEIKIEEDVITFQWWIREPKFVFSVIEHLMSEPPQYIGGEFNGGSDDETDEDPSPASPSSFRNWVSRSPVGAL